LPPARTHFWIDTARGGSKGTGSSPRKIGTKGIIPELVNMGADGWCGIRPAEDTAVCPLSVQNRFQVRRSSSASIGLGSLPTRPHHSRF
jgi:hypothetical protein